jgi:hypothetical protein
MLRLIFRESMILFNDDVARADTRSPVPTLSHMTKLTKVLDTKKGVMYCNTSTNLATNECVI